MPRFRLNEYRTPDFASHIPDEDKEERPIQKIEKFATFLNEVPWFSRSEDADSAEETSEESSIDPDMQGYEPGENTDSSNASDKMKGYYSADDIKENDNQALVDKQTARDALRESGNPDDPNYYKNFVHEDGSALSYEELEAMAASDPAKFKNLQRTIKPEGWKPTGKQKVWDDGIMGGNTWDQYVGYVNELTNRAKYGMASQLADKTYENSSDEKLKEQERADEFDVDRAANKKVREALGEAYARRNMNYSDAPNYKGAHGGYRR